MKCPSKDRDVNEKFEEMTSAAGRADEAEKGAEEKLQEVKDKEKVLLKTVTDGVELTSDGIVEFKNLVKEALKQAQEAKKILSAVWDYMFECNGIRSKSYLLLSFKIRWKAVRK